MRAKPASRVRIPPAPPESEHLRALAARFAFLPPSLPLCLTECSRMSSIDPAVRAKLIAGLEVSDSDQRGARADRIIWMGAPNHGPSRILGSPETLGAHHRPRRGIAGSGRQAATCAKSVRSSQGARQPAHLWEQMYRAEDASEEVARRGRAGGVPSDVHRLPSIAKTDLIGAIRACRVIASTTHRHWLQPHLRGLV